MSIRWRLHRTRKTNRDTGAVTEYEYDARNRLIAAKHFPEGADSPAWTASYAYDAANRRIAKTVTGEIERNVEYLWFGDRLVAEYHDGASSPTRRYRYAETGAVPLSYSDANGDYSVHSDALATPKALTNSSGTTVWSSVLSPYGQPTVNRDIDGDGREVAFNMRLPGQYHDRATGLYYNRNRSYDPATGRYLQSDPIGLNGGVNTYVYAHGNPINLIDPEGLESVPSSFGFSPQSSIRNAGWKQKLPDNASTYYGRSPIKGYGKAYFELMSMAPIVAPLSRGAQAASLAKTAYDMCTADSPSELESILVREGIETAVPISLKRASPAISRSNAERAGMIGGIGAEHAYGSKSDR